MFLEYSGNIILWLLEFAKRSTFVISYCYWSTSLLTQKQHFHRELLKKSFLLKCSLNVSWMSRTLQRWGNKQRIFPEYCVPAGQVYFTNNKIPTIKININKVCKYCDDLDNAKKAKKLYFYCSPFWKMKKKNFSVGKCC